MTLDKDFGRILEDVPDGVTVILITQVTVKSR
jgi:hypothetical protein